MWIELFTFDNRIFLQDGAESVAMIRATTRMAVLAMFLPLIECRRDPTVCETNLRSPDGAGGGPIRNAYVLSDANRGVNLKLTWLTPTHLEIDYNGKIEPDLQVVKFGGADISPRQISAVSFSGR